MFWRDAVELSRTMFGNVQRGNVIRAALSQDSYAITTLNHLRVLARRWHIPFVNGLLRRVQTLFYGIEIGSDVTLGLGVYFVHTQAIVIGGDAVIGDRVRFYGSNTVGAAKDDGYPTIGSDVIVGAGARILGPITVGAGARIGANAVVLTDVPPGSVAVGIPARVIGGPSVAANTSTSTSIGSLSS